jgi:hypothetical protein
VTRSGDLGHRVFSSTILSKPNILLTNDDGYGAEGLRALVLALEDFATLWVVAPFTEHNR